MQPRRQRRGRICVESWGVSERSEPTHSRPKQVPIQSEIVQTAVNPAKPVKKRSRRKEFWPFRHAYRVLNTISAESCPLIPCCQRFLALYSHLPDRLMLRITPFASLVLLCLAAGPV